MAGVPQAISSDDSLDSSEDDNDDDDDDDDDGEESPAQGQASGTEADKEITIPDHIVVHLQDVTPSKKKFYQDGATAALVPFQMRVKQMPPEMFTSSRILENANLIERCVNGEEDYFTTKVKFVTDNTAPGTPPDHKKKGGVCDLLTGSIVGANSRGQRVIVGATGRVPDSLLTDTGLIVILFPLIEWEQLGMYFKKECSWTLSFFLFLFL